MRLLSSLLLIAGVMGCASKPSRADLEARIARAETALTEAQNALARAPKCSSTPALDELAHIDEGRQEGLKQCANLSETITMDALHCVEGRMASCADWAASQHGGDHSILFYDFPKNPLNGVEQDRKVQALTQGDN